MARWLSAACTSCCVFGFTLLAFCYPVPALAAEIPPLVGDWRYTANKCTNFSNAGTWAEDCRILDGGIWTGSNTSSDPLRCENAAHPRPWSSESIIEPLASARSGGTASLSGWQTEESYVHCVGVFDTASLSKTLGVESANVSLIAIDENAGAWGARRDRDVECPPGSRTLSDRCLQVSAPDPYRAFEMCLNNGTNPVNVFTGAKIHTETDFYGSGPNPLILKRYYSTRTRWREAAWEDSGFGRYWRHNFTRSISHFKSDTFEAVVIYRANGNRHYFHPYDLNGDTVWRASAADLTADLRQAEIDGITYWEYFRADGVREFYLGETGQLVKIERPEGFSLSLTYDNAGRLSVVDNGFGRQLRFAYGTEGFEKDLIITISLYANDIPVVGGTYLYAYEETDRSGYQVMLDKVIYPDETPEDGFDNPVKDYLYNEPEHIYFDEPWVVDVTDGPSNRSVNLPHHLTGIIDENGNRFATYKYQRVLFNGGYRYILPVWGGNGSPDDEGAYANEFKITRYHPDSHRADSRSFEGYAVILDALDASRQFHFKNYSGVLRPTKVVGGNCEVCGSETQFTRYDESGFVSERIDFAGNKTLFARDEKGAETCRIEGVSNDDVTKNAPRRIVTSWDHAFRVVLDRKTFELGANANLESCSVSDDNGWVLRHKLTNIYEPDSSRIASRAEHSYDNLGIEEGLPRVTTYTYYGIGEQHGLPNQLKQIDGPRNDVVDVKTFRYATDFSDEHSPGDLVEIENALGHITRITKHDRFGRVLEIVGPNGVTTTSRYAPRGWITSRSIDGKQTLLEYDRAGLLTKVISPNGASVAYGYDTAHRLTSTTDNIGNTIRYELDPMGNRIVERYEEPGGVLRKKIRRVYNNLNQLEKLVSYKAEADQYESGFVYHADGSLFREIDARDPGMGQGAAIPVEPTIFAAHSYDALGRRITTRDEEGGYVQYDYDIFDRIVRVTEPNDVPDKPQRLVTSYDYNSFGELKMVSSPDTGVTRYSYDQAGNRLTWESASHRAAGVLVNYHYDALNRMTFIDYPLDEQDITYVYDAEDPSRHGIGRLTGVGEASGDSQFFYDGQGNITRIESLRDGVSSALKYTYNAAKQVESITTPGGKTIRYLFQHLASAQQSHLLESIEVHSADSQQVLVDDIRYAPFGPIESWRYGNGVRAVKPLDFSYQVTSVSYDNFIKRQYHRDPVHNPHQISDLLSGADTTFNYDGLNRLTAYNLNEHDISLAYDSIGNRRTVSTDGALTSYTYSPNTHHLISIAGGDTGSFSYDPGGRVSLAGNKVLSYGFNGRLATLSPNDESSTSYIYDAFGRRTEKNSLYKTVYHYDLQGRLIEESDGFGNPAKTYVYMEGIPVAMIAADLDPFSDEDADGMRNGFEQHFGFDAWDAGDALLDNDADGFSNLSEHDAASDPTDPVSVPLVNTATVKQIPIVGKIAGLIVAAAIMALVLPHLNSASLVVCVVLIFSWLIAETASAKTHYIHSDHLGTPIAMTDASKTVTWSAEYAPFGAAMVHPASSAELNLRFPGQYFDKESGLHHNYFRDYDPKTGRYFQSDPIGLLGGLNTYSYAMNNPLRFTDPYGLFAAGLFPPSPGPFGSICGGEGARLASWIPDVFEKACRRHDECYSCSGLTKTVCDLGFLRRMTRSCDGFISGVYVLCKVAAYTYFTSVEHHGETFYKQFGHPGCEDSACAKQ